MRKEYRLGFGKDKRNQQTNLTSKRIREEERVTLKEVAIGLFAGAIYMLACGWLYIAIVTAR
tara:strand:- start:353 stop:538 length:186 start_codon:yes stop_codon:yes gene_type:complete